MSNKPIIVDVESVHGSHAMMTNDQFDEFYESNHDIQDMHMDYIIRHCGPERCIADGDCLIEAQEDKYLYEEFRAYYILNNLKGR